MKIKPFALLLLAFASLLPIMFMASCGKEDIEEDITGEYPKSADSYYIKYEVQRGIHVNNSSSSGKMITYKDVILEHSISTNQEWNGTYGPFKKGDKVYLRVNATTSGYNANARISVSKNKEAFAIKAEKRESQNIDIEYTINY